MPPRTFHFDAQAQEKRASRFQSLHTTPPLLLVNVWDASLAKTIAALPQTKAIASASYAVAEAAGINDAELDSETNLAALVSIGRVADQHNLPFTADCQHGYGDELEAFFSKVIQEAGVVGCNLEDLLPDESGVLPIEEACSRIKRVKAVAQKQGVPSFVVNARVDILNFPHGTVEEAVKRGKAYVEAGAGTVFVWRKGPGLNRDEIQSLVKALPAGRFNTQARRGGLSVKELGELGVGRISIGPGFLHEINDLVTRRAQELAGGGGM
ncbi:Phosphoenolpyruvate/pyruvate domain-containing protein [Myriangium duriaei CBS 260.36]|uniref:Phosphoenolpyruvate/pyruvate domain-containing protein n=1 Tax=Myriangium duriaei CBS 260.36 TaxID=1168546 RepID=A0A9P4J699_9PEZI|nr:Phosphoenolpyruvate/pyruvate domain-containing protein [Myriangium duriaei CBS 260.36]